MTSGLVYKSYKFEHDLHKFLKLYFVIFIFSSVMFSFHLLLIVYCMSFILEYIVYKKNKIRGGLKVTFHWEAKRLAVVKAREKFVWHD